RLGVEKFFHKVAQRPGKPFWFGRHPTHGCLIFSYPGNPVSTFLGHILYFVPWLDRALGRETQKFDVIMGANYSNTTELTLFLGAKIGMESGKLIATFVPSSGSGDLPALTLIDGFVRIAPLGSVKTD